MSGLEDNAHGPRSSTCSLYLPENRRCELEQTLGHHVVEEIRQLFGNVDSRWVEYAKNYHGGWDERDQSFRVDDLTRYGFLAGRDKLLDIAAGCGQFVQCATRFGYEVWGLEPEEWKRDFIRQKFDFLGLPGLLSVRVLAGVGEAIPFPDNAFDCVTSYQTLEHVQGPARVLQEMVRVTKVGGGICIRCPDYRSTFEAHYQLPWLPLFPRRLAKLYLRALGRPVAGLDGISYVTKPRIKNWLSGLEINGTRLLVVDDARLRFENILRRKGIPLLPGAYEAKELLQWVSVLFRRELSVSLFVRVLAK